jgi:hypothetical protein
MPKLKYDLVLARQDDLIYGLPHDANDDSVSSRAFEIHGIDAMRVKPGRELLTHYDLVKKGTAVTVKFVLDEGAPVGARRAVIFVGGEEVLTADWALEDEGGPHMIRGQIGHVEVDGVALKLWLDVPAPIDPAEWVTFTWNGTEHRKTATWEASTKSKPDDTIPARRLDSWGGAFVNAQHHMAGSAEPRGGGGDVGGSK